MTNTPIRAFFIDLDDTVYPASSGVWPLAGERMVTYMHEVLGIPLAEAPALRERLFHIYGTTLRGLQREYGVDMDDYLHYVHDLDLPSLLQPDAELRQALLQLPQPKWPSASPASSISATCSPIASPTQPPTRLP